MSGDDNNALWPPQATTTTTTLLYPAPSIDTLLGEAGRKIGEHLGRAAANGELGAQDAWQSALAILGQLRAAVDAAIDAEPSE